MLVEMTAHRRQTILEEMGTRNGRWFDTEVEKLDHWAEDRSESLKAELAELDESLKSARKAARTAPSLPRSSNASRKIRRLDARRNEALEGLRSGQQRAVGAEGSFARRN